MNDTTGHDDNDTPRTATVEDMRTGYDWSEAVGFSCKSASALPGYSGPVAWGPDDIAEVLASDEGENDGPNWIALLRLADGRLVAMSAGCDYTGWDCQAGGGSLVGGPDLEAMHRLGLDPNERERMRITMAA